MKQAANISGIELDGLLPGNKINTSRNVNGQGTKQTPPLNRLVEPTSKWQDEVSLHWRGSIFAFCCRSDNLVKVDY
jgi:hypothetical protein